MKILVIDDSSTDRKLIIRALRKKNIDNEIIEASDGEKALEVLANTYKEICLILLDWQMPNIDGMEFMRGVVKVPQVASIPIVMVTASGTEEAKNCARRVNPNLAGYIIKPFKPEELIQIISPHLK